MKTPSKTILITGATDGLGRKAATNFAKSGHRILLHGRSRARLEDTKTEIFRATGNEKVRSYLSDLSDLEQVRSMAKSVISEVDHLDILINNAGVGGGSAKTGQREISKQGYELRFAVNYLSHYLLTRLLLPLLKSSAPSRIIHVSSVGQHPIDFENLMLETEYESFRAYRQSKLAQIMHTIDLANELQGSGVTVNALHPATLMDTKMVQEWFGYTRSKTEDGVEALYHLAISPELEEVSGEYFDQRTKSRAKDQAYDSEARKRLKEFSDKAIADFL